MTQIWIFLLFFGICFLLIGFKSFIWKEKPGDKTHPGVAVVMIVLGGGLLFFMGQRLVIDLLQTF